MSDLPEQPAETESINGDAPGNGWTRFVGILKTSENLLLVAVLTALMLLPLAEAFLRKFFEQGIPGAAAITQHFTLIIGMLGGAIAARENRLLSMSALPVILKGKAKAICVFGGFSVAAAMTIFLIEGGISFVSEEKTFGDLLVGKLPVWVMEAFIPFGFILVAIRIWLNTSEKWAWRFAALVPIVILFWLWRSAPGGAENLVWPALAVLAVATVMGAPVFVTLGGAAALLFWGSNGGAWMVIEGEAPISNIASLALDHYSLNTNPTLPTVPLFTLAGYFLAEGGASKRLVAVFRGSSDGCGVVLPS